MADTYLRDLELPELQDLALSEGISATRIEMAPTEEDPDATHEVDLTFQELLDAFISAKGIDELKSLPEVSDRGDAVRKNLRADVEAAVRGEATEKDREAAARELADFENEVNPSTEEVESSLVYVSPASPPQETEPVQSEWTQADDGTPTQADGT